MVTVSAIRVSSQNFMVANLQDPIFQHVSANDLDFFLTGNNKTSVVFKCESHPPVKLVTKFFA